MVLIFNSCELFDFYGFNTLPDVYIENKKISVITEKARAKDATSKDICIFIPYDINGLSSDEKYNVLLSFNYNNIKLDYNIEVDAYGVIPSIKDNKNLFIQSFAYNNKKKRWLKMQIEEDELGNNKLIVKDDETIGLLKDIKELLSKLVK